MARYVYLKPNELYDKLKRLLELNVKFGDNIRDKYFCIFAKSKILAIKSDYIWFVNSDNWSINNISLLHNLKINAITPGSYALKQLKESIKEVYYTYQNLWPRLTNDINRVIKSGYNSGLLYARPGFYNQEVYHYDKNSAYAEAFKKAEVPVGAPKIIKGFVKPDKEHLNIYCMDLNVEYTSTTIFPYLVNSGDITKLPSQIVDSTGYSSLYKVITQTEYLDMVKDYDTVENCLYTIQFNKKSGLFDTFVDKYYHLKNNAIGDEQVIYKFILASLAGKLAQSIDEQQIPIGVNEFGVIQYETKKIPLSDIEYINPAVSLFIVDYVRKQMRDIIRKVGYKNVVLVDTDGFISLKKLDIPLSRELGGFKMKTYSNLIVNGKRSYFYTEDNQFHSSISGLGDIYEDAVNEYDFNAIKNLHKLKSSIPIIKKVMYCGKEKYVSMNVHIGDDS